MKILSVNLIRLITIIISISVYLTFQVGENCSSGQYFDTNKLECNICPKSMIPTSQGNNYF